MVVEMLDFTLILKGVTGVARPVVGYLWRRAQEQVFENHNRHLQVAVREAFVLATKSAATTGD